MKNILILGLIVVVSIFGVQVLLNKPLSGETQLISSTGLHWHPQLEIYIKGEKQEIPADMGLGVMHSPIHTHDDLPIIHMEFSGKVTEGDTKIGNFFRVWGKNFNSDQLFDYKNSPEANVKMFVNGEENTEFENYKMKDGDKIEIRYE